MNWIHKELNSIGFEPAEQGTFQRGPFHFNPDGDWPVLSTLGKENTSAGALGMPGLWKRTGRDQKSVSACSLPWTLLHVADGHEGHDGDGVAPLSAFLTWAMATADGVSPEGWQAPDPDEVAAWLPKNGLTIQRGTIARQIEIHRAADSFSLRVKIHSSALGELPERRRLWLNSLLEEAHCRWRLARVGTVQDGEGSHILGEVDLTGVPPILFRPCFLAGLDTLRWLVLSLAEPAAFLWDGRAHSNALQSLSPAQQTTHN